MRSQKQSFEIFDSSYGHAEDGERSNKQIWLDIQRGFGELM